MSNINDLIFFILTEANRAEKAVLSGEIKNPGNMQKLIDSGSARLTATNKTPTPGTGQNVDQVAFNKGVDTSSAGLSSVGDPLANRTAAPAINNSVTAALNQTPQNGFGFGPDFTTKVSDATTYNSNLDQHLANRKAELQQPPTLLDQQKQVLNQHQQNRENFQNALNRSQTPVKPDVQFPDNFLNNVGNAVATGQNATDPNATPINADLTTSQNVPPVTQNTTPPTDQQTSNINDLTSTALQSQLVQNQIDRNKNSLANSAWRFTKGLGAGIGAAGGGLAGLLGLLLGRKDFGIASLLGAGALGSYGSQTMPTLANMKNQRINADLKQNELMNQISQQYGNDAANQMMVNARNTAQSGASQVLGNLVNRSGDALARSQAIV